MPKHCLIYDFETLGTKMNAVVLELGVLMFDFDRLGSDEPYQWDELMSMSSKIKFNVAEQTSVYNRVIDRSTLDWWAKQDKEAQKVMKPSDEDKSIKCLPDFMLDVIGGKTLKSVYTRGNNFDPILLETIYSDLKKPIPYFWSKIRDTRSMIEGLSYGVELKNTFMPTSLKDKELVLHDARTDVCLDVFRMQELCQAIK